MLLSRRAAPVGLCFALLLTATSCAPETDEAVPSEGFSYAHTVRVLSPSNGETVTPDFEVAYQAGSDIAEVAVQALGEIVAGPLAPSADGAGSFTLALDEGRVPLSLIGYDRQGEVLAQHDLNIRVAAEGSPWVTLTSPADGATVANPVQFTFSADETVDTIEVEADGWSLGTVIPGETLIYTFSGTGYSRQIAAYASADGEVVAEDAIEITVSEGTNPDVSDFNAAVVSVLESYPTDGSYEYYWPSGSGSGWMGTTQDIYYLDTLVAEGDPYNRSYCVGLTWEVFMHAFDQIDAATYGDGSLNGATVSELYDFVGDWFVHDLYGSGVVEAMENIGIGEQVTNLADLQPGDFLQFWRNSGSGHSTIFIDWELDDDGHIIGIQYWSTQNSTDGIGYSSEYFGSSSSSLDPSYFYAARAWMPVDWLPW